LEAAEVFFENFEAFGGVVVAVEEDAGVGGVIPRFVEFPEVSF